MRYAIARSDSNRNGKCLRQVLNTTMKIANIEFVPDNDLMDRNSGHHSALIMNEDLQNYVVQLITVKCVGLAAHAEYGNTRLVCQIERWGFEKWRKNARENVFRSLASYVF